MNRSANRSAKKKSPGRRKPATPVPPESKASTAPPPPLVDAATPAPLLTFGKLDMARLNKHEADIREMASMAQRLEDLGPDACVARVRLLEAWSAAHSVEVRLFTNDNIAKHRRPRGDCCCREPVASNLNYALKVG